MNSTSRYYATNAKMYAEKNNHESVMEEMRKRFLKYLPSGARIHDYGCGTGRDLYAFQQEGHTVHGYDVSEEMLNVVLTYYPTLSGHVSQLDFLSDSWGVAPNSCQGFWACASLLHVEKESLLPVLTKLSDTVVDGGVGYISVKPKESTTLSVVDGRMFQFWNKDDFIQIVSSVFTVLSSEETTTSGANWLNLIVKG